MKNITVAKILMGMILYTFSIIAAGNELSIRSLILQQARNNLIAGNFAQLELDAQLYRRDRQRTPSGIWKLTVFYNGISQVFNTKQKDENFWKSRQELVEAWLSKYPTSPTAHLAMAQMILNRGKSIGVNKDMSEIENRRLFYTYISKTHQYLEDHKDIASADPRWYEMMERVASLQRWNRSRFESLLDEGLKRYPDFYQIYFAAIDHYTENEKEASNDIENLARRAMEATKEKAEKGIYARIYWYAAQAEYGDELFRYSKVDWPLMREGIESVISEYPDNWNINNFAKLSCLAGDKENTNILLSKIEGEPIIETWGNFENYRRCKSWSNFNARPSGI